MKRIINHKSIVIPEGEDGLLSTTLCRRMELQKDGVNVDPVVTCKFCIQILNNPKHWANRQMVALNDPAKQNSTIIRLNKAT
jgi:hypothetical protein